MAAVMFFTISLIALSVVFLAGRSRDRIRLQTAADAGAKSLALEKARGLNKIAAYNMGIMISGMLAETASQAMGLGGETNQAILTFFQKNFSVNSNTLSRPSGVNENWVRLFSVQMDVFQEAIRDAEKETIKNIRQLEYSHLKENTRPIDQLLEAAGYIIVQPNLKLVWQNDTYQLAEIRQKWNEANVIWVVLEGGYNPFSIAEHQFFSVESLKVSFSSRAGVSTPAGEGLEMLYPGWDARLIPGALTESQNHTLAALRMERKWRL
jgi:hypothetical protein